MDFCAPTAYLRVQLPADRRPVHSILHGASRALTPAFQSAFRVTSVRLSSRRAPGLLPTSTWSSACGRMETRKLGQAARCDTGHTDVRFQGLRQSVSWSAAASISAVNVQYSRRRSHDGCDVEFDVRAEVGPEIVAGLLAAGLHLPQPCRLPRAQLLNSTRASM